MASKRPSNVQITHFRCEIRIQWCLIVFKTAFRGSNGAKLRFLNGRILKTSPMVNPTFSMSYRIRQNNLQMPPVPPAPVNQCERIEHFSFDNRTHLVITRATQLSFQKLVMISILESRHHGLSRSSKFFESGAISSCYDCFKGVRKKLVTFSRGET